MDRPWVVWGQNMLDVLLVQAPIRTSAALSGSGRDFPFLGPLYIATVLKQSGISVRFLNMGDSLHGIDAVVDLCASERPKILAISANTPAIRGAVRLAGAAKARFGDAIHTLLGGIHVTIDPGVAERYPCFDSAIIGEAETVIVEHVRAILDDADVRGTRAAKFPGDLDGLPFPDFSLIEGFRLGKGDSIPIVGSRGCPHRCAFCAVAVLGRKVRARSPANVLEEIKQRLPMGRSFWFVDDAATVNLNRILVLCEMILRAGLRIRFEMVTRFDLLNIEAVTLLKRAGCYKLAFGVESGDERIRNEIIHKRLSDKAIIDGMSLVKRAGILADLYFMLGHPTETVGDIEKTIHFPLELERRGFRNIDLVGFHLTQPLPGTEYYRRAIDEGKIAADTTDGYINGAFGEGFGRWPVYVPDGMTIDFLRERETAANKRYYMRPRYAARRLLRNWKKPELILSDAGQMISVLMRGKSSRVSAS